MIFRPKILHRFDFNVMVNRPWTDKALVSTGELHRSGDCTGVESTRELRRSEDSKTLQPQVTKSNRHVSWEEGEWDASGLSVLPRTRCCSNMASMTSSCQVREEIHSRIGIGISHIVGVIFRKFGTQYWKGYLHAHGTLQPHDIW